MSSMKTVMCPHLWRRGRPVMVGGGDDRAEAVRRGRKEKAGFVRTEDEIAAALKKRSTEDETTTALAMRTTKTGGDEVIVALGMRTTGMGVAGGEGGEVVEMGMHVVDKAGEGVS